MDAKPPPRLLFFRKTPFLRRSTRRDVSCSLCGDLRPRDSKVYVSLSGPRKVICSDCIGRRLPTVRIDPRTKQPVID